MGVRTFRPTDDPKLILNTLRSNYGRMTPLEKLTMEKRSSEGWNPNKPIENFFDRLEYCNVQSITQPPSYTTEQMVDKALTAIQTTSLVPTAIFEWNGFMDGHQTKLRYWVNWWFHARLMICARICRWPCWECLCLHLWARLRHHCHLLLCSHHRLPGRRYIRSKCCHLRAGSLRVRSVCEVDIGYGFVDFVDAVISICECVRCSMIWVQIHS